MDGFGRLWLGAADGGLAGPCFAQPDGRSNNRPRQPDRDHDAELERLLAIGARPADIGQTGNESWHVLADPEGNEFCLLRRRVAPM